MNSNNTSLGPTSIGSLLTEEWMIQPYAPLPSFIEMIMIDDTALSVRKAVQAVINSFHAYLIRTINRQRRNEQNNQPITQQLPSRITRMISSLKAWFYFRRIQLYKRLERIIYRNETELIYLMLYMIERQCLRSPASSARFAETVYGTRRVKLQEQQQQQKQTSSNDNIPSDMKNRGTRYKLLPLSSTDATRLALIVTFGPYMKEKLQRLFRKWKFDTSTSFQQQQQQSNATSLESRFRQFFVLLYPLVVASIDGCNTWCKWRYLLGRSFSYDLPSLLLGQIVRRRVVQDDHQQQKFESSSSDSKSAVLSDQAKKVTNNNIDGKILQQNDMTARSNNSLSTKNNSFTALPLWQKPIVYFLSSVVALCWLAQIRAEYLEYNRRRQQEQRQQRAVSNAQNRNHFNLQDNDVVEEMTELLIPPFPRREQNQTTDSKLCPLCFRRRVHPTASSSGYVFCLKCIKLFVKEHGTCPVTGMSCTESNLVRLYEPVSQHH